MTLSINLSSHLFNIIINQAQTSGITPDKYIESIIIIKLYELGYKPTNDELKNMLYGITLYGKSTMSSNSTNQRSTTSRSFREKILILGNNAPFATIAFIHGLKIIPDLKMIAKS